MALTEQDFANAINDKTPHSFCDVYPECARKSCKFDDDGIIICSERNSLARECFRLHTSECERREKLAFNAAKAKREESDFPYPLEKYRTYQDFKDSLK